MKCVCVKEAASTNDLAFELAADGATLPLAVIAERQSGGRGRCGRSWVSEKGKGLYLSVAFFLDMPAAQFGRISIMAAFAVQNVLVNYYGLSIEVKWPNDILVSSRKITGILIENREILGKRCCVIGIGINTNWEKDDLEGDFRWPPTSLSLEVGKNISHKKLLKRVLRKLKPLFDKVQGRGWSQVLGDVEKSLYGKGRPVFFTNGADEKCGQEGIVVGLDRDGGIIIETSEGEQVTVCSGEVAFADRN